MSFFEKIDFRWLMTTLFQIGTGLGLFFGGGEAYQDTGLGILLGTLGVGATASRTAMK
jgi:hypothetical protein